MLVSGDYFASKDAGLSGELATAGTIGTSDNSTEISPKRVDAKQLTELFDQGMRNLRTTGRLAVILGR